MALTRRLRGQDQAWVRSGQRRPARAAAADEGQDARGDPGARAALFGDQGLDATTVEQIAAAAEASPSTFFRYYPAKEDVLTGDGIDALAVQALAAQPPGLGPVAAVRAALASALASLPRRISRDWLLPPGWGCPCRWGASSSAPSRR
jgi:hypothetical protein